MIFLMTVFSIEILFVSLHSFDTLHSFETNGYNKLIFLGISVEIHQIKNIL